MMNLSEFKELIGLVKRYNNFLNFEDKQNINLNEKKKILNAEKIDDEINQFNENNNYITKMLTYSKCKDIDELLVKIEIANEIKEKKNRILEQEEILIGEIKILKSFDINIKGKILKNMNYVGLDENVLNELNYHINEYREKLRQYQEIKVNIKSIENTYIALLKDRDIEEIKNELKSVTNYENQYSFRSEEEIELEEKKKNNELLQCEKTIKDIENDIKNRLIGSRDIVTIDEELFLLREEKQMQERKVKAIDIALENIKKSLEEIRRGIGPEINAIVSKIFSQITDGEYIQVKMDENYKMVVKNEKDIFKGDYLSNGALDQLYLALRLSFVQILFNKEKCPVFLDDAFIQYDDKRREKALEYIVKQEFMQKIIFTCQKNEERILRKIKSEINYIILK